MKKQWLSIILALCMVLCLAPATALAAEGETCELKITVEVNGLIGSAEGAEFTFQIKKAINEVTAQYYEYGTTTVTVRCRRLGYLPALASLRKKCVAFLSCFYYIKHIPVHYIYLNWFSK